MLCIPEEKNQKQIYEINNQKHSKPSNPSTLPYKLDLLIFDFSVWVEPGVISSRPFSFTVTMVQHTIIIIVKTIPNVPSLVVVRFVCIV